MDNYLNRITLLKNASSLYKIFYKDKQKYIKVYCNFYDVGFNYKNETSRCSIYVDYELPLHEFLENLNDDDWYFDYEGNRLQSFLIITLNEAYGIMSKYCDVTVVLPLSYVELSMETKCGFYVNIVKEA